MRYILLKNGGALCRDGKLRSFSGFGNVSCAYKMYKTWGHAKRKANQICANILEVPAESPTGEPIYITQVNSENVFELSYEVDDEEKPGYIRRKTLPIEDFIFRYPHD